MGIILYVGTYYMYCIGADGMLDNDIKILFGSAWFNEP